MGGRPVKPYYLWTSRRANHPRHHDPRLRHAEGMNSSILQPSTVRQVGCAQEREDLRSTGSSFGGVCATATSSLPPSLSARRKLEAKRRQTCYTIYTATPTTTSTCSAGRTCAEATDCPTCCRVRYSNAACYSLFFLPMGHVNRPFQRVCSVLKNIVRSSAIRYAPLLTLYTVMYFSIEISTAVQHPFLVGTELPMGRVTVLERVLPNSPHS